MRKIYCGIGLGVLALIVVAGYIKEAKNNGIVQRFDTKTFEPKKSTIELNPSEPGLKGFANAPANDSDSKQVLETGNCWLKFRTKNPGDDFFFRHRSHLNQVVGEWYFSEQSPYVNEEAVSGKFLMESTTHFHSYLTEVTSGSKFESTCDPAPLESIVSWLQDRQTKF